MIVPTAPKTRPLVRNAEQVRALLNGATQFRLPVRSAWLQAYPIADKTGGNFIFAHRRIPSGGWEDCTNPIACSIGDVGVRLWVKETWQTHCDMDGIAPNALPVGSALQYPATYDHWKSKKRITLEITGIRVQRVQDISEADAIAEGAGFWSQTSGCLDSQAMLNRWCRASVQIAAQRNESRPTTATVVGAFACYWDSLNAKRFPWSSNPWCWALSVKRINADAEGGGE